MKYPAVPRILGLIPAKAASTRLPRKNIRLLGGRPLLAWTAVAAYDSCRFNQLIVSTEDDEIAAIARQLGLEVPFMRPAPLAVDPVEVNEVALHAVETLARQSERFDILAIMLPTCPFRTAHDIREAFDLFLARDDPNVMSVAPFEHTPFAAVQIEPDGTLRPLFPDRFAQASSRHPGAWRPNGAIHVLDIAWYLKSRNYAAGPVAAYQMPRGRSLDIDTEDDFRLAEHMVGTWESKMMIGTVAGVDDLGIR